MQRAVIVSLLTLPLLGCPPATDGDGAKKGEPVTLVVYCGRSEALVGETFKVFQAQYPEIKLDLRYNKTPALASQAMSEKDACPADMFWFQDSGYLGALGKAGMLAELPKDVHERADARFRAADKTWVGITGRLRCLVYNTDAVKPKDLPQNLKALADPKWKGKLGWAPGNASFQAHVSHLRHTWGEEETKNWLLALKENAPASYPKNSPQVKACAKGELTIGWVNHYYLHKLKTDGFKAKNYSFPEDDGGNVLMVAGAAIRKGSKAQAAAKTLLDYLLSETIQSQFAERSFEYPVVPGVPAHPDVPALKDLELSEVEQQHLTDVGPTLKLLKELGLQ